MAKTNDAFGVVAIQLTRKMWMGNTKLRPEDLGLPSDAKIPDIVTLGYKKLYPKAWQDLFKSLYERARYIIKINTLPFITDHIRACPKGNMATLIARLEPIKVEWAEAKVRFSAHYEQIKAEMEAKYPDLWPTMKDFYPDVEVLDEKFDLDWAVYEIKSASYTSTSSAEVTAAYNKAKEQLNKKLHQMVEESVTYLRQRVLNTVKSLRDKIVSGKIVRNDTLDAVRNVHDWFNELNVFGDKTVEESLKTLRQAMNGLDSEGLKDNEALAKTLTELADKVATDAENLEDLNYLTGNFKRTLEI